MVPAAHNTQPAGNDMITHYVFDGDRDHFLFFTKNGTNGRRLFMSLCSASGGLWVSKPAESND